MELKAASLDEMQHAERERLARMIHMQPPVTREVWYEQLKLFEKAGRDSESSLPLVGCWH